jgi:hypothetical protein
MSKKTNLALIDPLMAEVMEGCPDPDGEDFFWKEYGILVTKEKKAELEKILSWGKKEGGIDDNKGK